MSSPQNRKNMTRNSMNEGEVKAPKSVELKVENVPIELKVQNFNDVGWVGGEKRDSSKHHLSQYGDGWVRRVPGRCLC